MALHPLHPAFPLFRGFVVTYPANLPAAHATLADVRASDWGEEPALVVQPAGWPKDKAAASANYKRALELAAADGCDYALVLEDDVRVARRLRHDLAANPLVRRGQADLLTLFMPDLVMDPWERSEPHLGYRLARPRYSGPNERWEKYRLWGSQAYLMSRRFVLAALARWDRLGEGQDARVLSVANELQVPLYYTRPCLVEHVPAVTAFGTPVAYAPDFDPAFVLEVADGFHPPETVPGWLTRAEGELLYRAAAGRRVLELGTDRGRATVCLGQRAAAVVSVAAGDQAEAGEWARRYGVGGRVEFRRGDVADVCRGMTGAVFDLAFADTGHDAASVARDIAAARPLLAPGGLLAFHDYPDPGWPDVRRVVDAHARRFGWVRVEQVDYLGLFRTPG